MRSQQEALLSSASLMPPGGNYPQCKQHQAETSVSTCILIVATVAAFVYHNATYCGLVFDDLSAIKDNRDIRPQTPVWNLFKDDFWGTPMHKEQSHKSYRPLCVLTFRWNFLVHGLQPFGYHVVNVILHVVVCLLYLRLCCFFLSRTTSMVAAILFAVHPIHTEAVTGVVGRAELLSSIFILASFFSYIRATRTRRRTDWSYLVASLALAGVAMLCKEQGITVLAICAVYEVFVLQKLRLQDVFHLVESMLTGKFGLPNWARESGGRIAALVLTACLLLLVRLKVMGGQLPTFTRFDNPVSAADGSVRWLTYNHIAALHGWLLFFPSSLCCDWTMGTVPLMNSIYDSRNLGTVALYFLLLKLAHLGLCSRCHVVPVSAARRHDRQLETMTSRRTVVLVGLSFAIFPFLPASNLFFPVGFVVAERVLYAPSMGFSLLVAYGFSLLLQKRSRRKVLWVCLALLVFIHATKTFLRNKDWVSEYSLFVAGLKVNHRNAKLYNNVGHVLEGQGEHYKALEYFEKAIFVQPDDVGSYVNMGRTYNHLKMYQEAEEMFNKAKDLLPKPRPGESYFTKMAPNHLNVFVNLANLISKNESRLEEADALYRQAISMRWDYTQAYINRGDILIKLNRTKEAMKVYEKALEFDNNNPDIYYNLGVVSLEQGNTPQALAYLNKALEFDPDHEQALMNSAILILETGNPQLKKTAYERLLKLIDNGYENEKIYFNLGMMAMDYKDHQEAEVWLRKAVQTKNDFRSALFNLALLLADRQRPLEATPFLHQLLKNHPDHIKGLILLGDIYINNIKDLDAAEKCYRQILTLDPNNVQGLHNLCVVFVERGELEKAELCFTEALSLAPQREYIQRHLNIVQNILVQRQNYPTFHHNLSVS